METGKVVAVQHMDFKAEDGNQIRGDKYYITVPAQYRNWRDGVELITAFVSDGDPRGILSGSELHVGDSVMLEYGRNGKVVHMTLAV